jgi:hypothetical protein
VIYVSGKTFDSSSKKIKLWSDTKIKLKIPNYPCDWFSGGRRSRKVWVTVGGADSNKKGIKVIRPASCQ